MDAIVIRNVSKQFRKAAVRTEHTTLKSELVRWALRRPKPAVVTHLTALKDITLTVKKGQTFGLVGRNGSGKSTLLKLVTGIYQPTSGSIDVHGRISALLELGAGFHPDFSGRENILINGIILGMSRREIKSRIDEIIEFSELGEFADQPVRTYSSGMYARLAFSVATHVDPEILIVDEILSVGDAHFSHKSSAKMEEFTKAGKTILLVTHDLGTLERRCDVAAWLDGGVLRALGKPSDVVAQYNQAVAESEAAGKPMLVAAAPVPASTRQPKHPPPAEVGRRSGTFEVEITRVRILDAHGEPQTIFTSDSALSIAIDYEGADAVKAPYFEAWFRRGEDPFIWCASTAGLKPEDRMTLAPAGTLTLTLPRLCLAEGGYRLGVAVYADGKRVCDLHRLLYSFTVSDVSAEQGAVRLVHSWSLTPADLSLAEPGESAPASEAQASPRSGVSGTTRRA